MLYFLVNAEYVRYFFAKQHHVRELQQNLGSPYARGIAMRVRHHDYIIVLVCGIGLNLSCNFLARLVEELLRANCRSVIVFNNELAFLVLILRHHLSEQLFYLFTRSLGLHNRQHYFFVVLLDEHLANREVVLSALLQRFKNGRAEHAVQ